MDDRMEIDTPQAAAAAAAGTKRKHGELASSSSDAVDNSAAAMVDPAAISSAAAGASSSSDEPGSKRARLSVDCLSPSALASLTVERVCLRSDLEVLPCGRVLVHLLVYTPTAASRAKAKEARFEAKRAAMREKRAGQKAKGKERRAEARRERQEWEAGQREQGRSDQEIREAWKERAAAMPQAASAKKKSSREVQELKRSLLTQMRSHSLPRVVVDCAFDALMRLEEVCSLAKQLRFMYGHNIRSSKPMHLILTSLAIPPDGDVNVPDHFDELRKDAEARRAAAAAPAADSSVASTAAAASLNAAAFPSLAAAIPACPSPPVCYTRSILQRMEGFDRLPLDRTTRHYTECFDPASLVYLTAESPNVLTRIDPQKVYIIGGIVDHNRLKGLCHDLAGKGGIATARLPIQEYLVNDKRTVITVNQVFEILLRFCERGDSDWPAVFKAVLPARSNWQERKLGQSNSDAARDAATGNGADDVDEGEAENDQRMDEAEQEDVDMDPEE